MPTPEQTSEAIMAFLAQQMNAARDAVVNPANRDKLAQMIANATEPVPPEETDPVPPISATNPVTESRPINIGSDFDRLVIENLSFTHPLDEPLEQDAIRVTGRGNTLIIRNCTMRGPWDCCINIVPQSNGTIHQVLIEDCILLDARYQGIYIHKAGEISLINSVVDECGAPTIFTHGVYIQNYCGPINVVRSIISRSGSHAIQARSGGRIENSTFLFNPIGPSMGGGNYPEVNVGGVIGELRNCVTLGGGDIDINNKRGWGFYYGNIGSGVMHNCVIADGTGGFQLVGNLDCDQIGEAGIASLGVFNLDISGNKVLRWDGGIQVDPGPQGNVTISGMDDLKSNPAYASVDLSLKSLLPAWTTDAMFWSALRAGSIKAATLNDVVRARMGMSL